MKTNRIQKPEAQRTDCKLGDVVLRLLKGQIQRGRIIAHSRPNEHKYPLNIQVRWEDGRKQVLSPFDQTIVPPDSELALTAAMRVYLQQHDLMVVRKCACSTWTYQIACKKTLQVAYNKIVEETQAKVSLTLEEGTLWYEGKPEIVDSSTTLMVRQRALPEPPDYYLNHYC